jgi:hypothetical protein
VVALDFSDQVLANSAHLDTARGAALGAALGYVVAVAVASLRRPAPSRVLPDVP